MLKKLSQFFIYFIFFIIALIYFIPKASAYYFLESKLKTYDIIISSEVICDKALCLGVTNADIYMNSLKLVHVSEANIHLFIVYNRMNLNNVTLSAIAKEFIPLNIKTVLVSYSIFDPLNVKASAIGDFGEAKSTYNIFNGELHLELTPSKLMQSDYASTFKYLAKTEQGDYTYDKNF